MALDTLRKGTARILGLILVGLLVISFAVWGIADVFTGYGAQTLIRVGDTQLNSQDYLRAQQEVLRAMSAQAGRSLSLQEARALGLDARVLERLVGGAAVDTHAKHLGLAVSDAALLDQIMKDPAFKDGLGNFSPAAFAQALRNVGLNEQGYLHSMRETNLRRQLLTTIGEVAESPKVLLDALNRFNGETRILRYVLVPESAAGTVGEPTEEDLKRYYDNNQAKFTQPEYRKLGILAVTPETVKDQVNITENDLKATFEATKDQLGSPERRQLEQIAFPDNDAAKAAYEKIQSGTDFVEIAKTQGLNESDIDLGKVTRGELADPVIAEAAFTLEKDKVSEPITGKLGSVVLLRVTAIEPGKSLTYEEAKADIEKKLLKDRAGGAIFDMHDKIEDELASGAQLAEVADKLKLTYQSIDQVDRQGKQPDGSTVTLPAQKEVLNAAFATDTGVENDPIDAKDEGVIWYEVLGITPEQRKLFDQVEDEVAKLWRTNEMRNRAATYGQELVDSLTGGKTLEDLGKELNTEVLTSDALKRDGITVNVLPPTVAQAFTLPEGGYGSAASGIGEGRIVFKVDKVNPPTTLQEIEITRLKQQIGLLISEDAIAEYFSALESRYGVSINEQALAKLVGGGDEP
ncbi:MAG: peptidyl-prolyl cis-trans isomerase [Methyloceanibacter sp.]|uniref:peptidyl-prolyl cis-trans isomerase n=1 Tax=Methyloceanibacter sp. TaxID=1965321 RepID=UPI003D9B1604